MSPLEALARWASGPANAAPPADAERMVGELLAALERGEVRAAARHADGRWRANPMVKRGILLAFRIGRIEAKPIPEFFRFFDKHTIPLRQFRKREQVRIVPGGSAIRRGAYVGPGVVCMPPMFINVGAYVDEETMVDSHALVGSCAQIGRRVHLSAGAQIGGVLEPVNAAPVVIEDEALIGGSCGVYEGTVVRAGAVLAAGVVLTRGTPVYDLVKREVRRASRDAPLEIPEGAVVVPGARAIRSGWGEEQQLSLQTPVIVKYRDEKTDLATTLEEWLR